MSTKKQTTKQNKKWNKEQKRGQLESTISITALNINKQNISMTSRDYQNRLDKKDAFIIGTEVESEGHDRQLHP